MKIVNYTRGIYFFVGIFGITLFFGMLAATPKTVFAPPYDAGPTRTPPVDFGKPFAMPDDTRLPPEEAKPPVTRLVFVGDIMLARAVEWAIKDYGPSYPFARWDSALFTGAHAVIGNFEGTVRETERIEQTNVMAFDTLPQYLQPLADAGFTHLSLANNHADDFGQATTDFTRSSLTEAEVLPFGDPFVGGDFIARIQGDLPVSLIGFHAFNEDAAGIISAISAEDRAGNFVIVYPHWGTEYAHTPSTSQTSAADMWIAAGADLIIGAHPHVVQSVEARSGVPVVYSLGNFLFDQDFSRATQIGAVVDVAITHQEISLTFSPVEILARQMFVNHEHDDVLLSWLGISQLTWTVPREAIQTP